jgi:hypothetical protein
MCLLPRATLHSDSEHLRQDTSIATPKLTICNEKHCFFYHSSFHNQILSSVQVALSTSLFTIIIDGSFITVIIPIGL